MNIRDCRYTAALVFALFTLSAARADVTTRYKMEITMNPALSAMLAGAAKGIGSQAPQEMEHRLKGGKSFSASMGLTSIIDLPTKEMIILDPAAKAYAKATYDQFLEEITRAMPKIADQTRASVAAMKSSASPTRLTGRTAVIQGVEAEEREVVISVDGPSLPDVPAGPNVPARPMMRMVMQMWTAKASEALRVPALHELAGYSQYSYATMNPLGAIEQMMKPLPGFGDGFETMFREMQSAGLLLRMHIDLFMPAMAAMLQKIGAGAIATGAPLDYDAPFIQVNQELVELSSAPVPDSVFQIPEGYVEASVSDVIQALSARTKAAGKP